MWIQVLGIISGMYIWLQSSQDGDYFVRYSDSSQYAPNWRNKTGLFLVFFLKIDYKYIDSLIMLLVNYLCV